jgi:hypothetical protein
MITDSAKQYPVVETGFAHNQSLDCENPGKTKSIRTEINRRWIFMAASFLIKDP